MRKLKTVPVSWDNLEWMRKIYNDNIDKFSTTQKLWKKTANDQIEWWMDQRFKCEAWLYFENFNGGSCQPVAFSMLTNRGSFYTPIFAIDKEFHGKGYAREIIEHYLRNAWGSLAGSQRQDNKIICRLNKEFGWKIWGKRGGVDLLYHPGLLPKYPILVTDILKHHQLSHEEVMYNLNVEKN